MSDEDDSLVRVTPATSINGSEAALERPVPLQPLCNVALPAVAYTAVQLSWAVAVHIFSGLRMAIQRWPQQPSSLYTLNTLSFLAKTGGISPLLQQAPGSRHIT